MGIPSVAILAQAALFTCAHKSILARRMSGSVTEPYDLIGFGAMYVTKPHEFIGFGAMYVTKPYALSSEDVCWV